MNGTAIYSLRGTERTSDRYYRDVAALAQSVRQEALRQLKGVVRAEQEAGSLLEEQIVELLTLGVLWRVHGMHALSLPGAGQRVLRRLARLRRRGGWQKRSADLARGVLGTLLLQRSSQPATPLPRMTDLESLLGWLEATGEYQQEAQRLSKWLNHWAGQAPESYAEQIAAVLAFTRWFERTSTRVLGGYTEQVNRYLAEEQGEHRWREDIIATGRPRVEYHLNMVGAELMNQAYRQAFLQAPKKAVLLPACMRALPEGQCQATATSHHLRCTGCAAGCRVHQLTQMGRRDGFEVRIITHESSAFPGNETDGVAIVGIGCVSTLLSGGWKARSLGLPAQCVLLDYCGCKKHWHPTGVATDLNVQQFRRVMLGDGAAPARVPSQRLCCR